MVIDRTISGYPPLFVHVFAWLLITHREFLISLDACLVVVLIWDMDILIMMIDLYWLRILIPCFFSVFHWCIRLRHWHAGLLMIDLITLFSTLILILSWLLWSLHMHALTTVYHSTWHVDSLTCILFWSSLSMMIVSLSIWLSYSRLPCVYIDDISELCLIACCMTALLLHDCAPLVYVGRTSIPLSPIL